MISELGLKGNSLLLFAMIHGFSKDGVNRYRASLSDMCEWLCTSKGSIKIIRELGLPPLKFHGLRHTFATQMLSAKADVKVLSTILGHHDISTTLNIYVHPSQDDKRNAMAKLKF